MGIKISNALRLAIRRIHARNKARGLLKILANLGLKSCCPVDDVCLDFSYLRTEDLEEN